MPGNGLRQIPLRTNEERKRSQESPDQDRGKGNPPAPENQFKVPIRFRGREITYPEIALEDLREIAEELADVATIEQAPSMEGRTMGMVLAAAKSGKKKVVEQEKSDQPIET